LAVKICSYSKEVPITLALIGREKFSTSLFCVVIHVQAVKRILGMNFRFDPKDIWVSLQFIK
jgi:hypothetical protein